MLRLQLSRHSRRDVVRYRWQVELFFRWLKVHANFLLPFMPGLTKAFYERAISIPPAVKVNVISDRTDTVRASIHDVQFTLLLTVALVVMVIFVFLRSARATIIPTLAIPVSIIGAFTVIAAAGFTQLKLYFIVGMPGETMEDVQGIVDLGFRAREIGRRHLGPQGRFSVRFARSIQSSMKGGTIPAPLRPGARR